jgi:integrase
MHSTALLLTPFPLPRGITIRTNLRSSSLQLSFSCSGIKCRETLKLEPTRQNIRYAERLRAEIIDQIARDTFNYAEYFPQSARVRQFGESAAVITVGELLRNQLAGYEHATANGNLSPSTLIGYKKIMQAHLLPAFDTLPLAELTPALLRKWIGGLGVTAKCARNILTPLRSLLEDCVNDDLIKANPFNRIALKILLDRTSLRSRFELNPLSTDEVSRVLDTACGQERNFYQFAFTSGLRTSELIGLMWEDIDWDRGVVHVRRAVVQKIIKGPKTEAGLRDVVLLPAARAALQAQKEFTLLAGERVFNNPATGRPWESDGQIRKTSWTPLLKKAGVTYRNPYQTRHTYASTLLSSGANPWWIATQMGHKNVDMIFKHYGKWLPDGQRRDNLQQPLHGMEKKRTESARAWEENAQPQAA